MAETVRLTTTAKAAGCAAKLSPKILDSVLSRLPRPKNPNLLVGYETSDDAAVYRLADDLALVQTVDFFTPIVDDPFCFGQVAAANSLSDIYAMGGEPISALTIVAFPSSRSPEILEQILLGGLDKMMEASCTVVGGHSIRDDELKFGYSVAGLIHPERIWRNVGARPGDVLLLTKPLGTGVISTALKSGHAQESWIDAAIASMTFLNRDAAEALHQLERESNAKTHVHAVTDVTGFGLLGHLREMAIGSAVSMRIDHTRISYLPGSVEAAKSKFVSGGKFGKDLIAHLWPRPVPVSESGLTGTNRIMENEIKHMRSRLKMCYGLWAISLVATFAMIFVYGKMNPDAVSKSDAEYKLEISRYKSQVEELSADLLQNQRALKNTEQDLQRAVEAIRQLQAQPHS